MSEKTFSSFVLRCLLALLLSGIWADESSAAAAVAVDTESGYASQVLAKVLSKWNPPALRGNYSVQIKVSLDGSGRVKECSPVQPSSLEAFDQVACSAVYAAQPFGKTSYEAPLDIFLAFQLRENAPPMSSLGPSDADAIRAEVSARSRVERDLAATIADATEQRARERALAAARSRGQTLPEMPAASVDKKTDMSLPKEKKPALAGRQPQEQRLPSYGEQVPRSAQPTQPKTDKAQAAAEPQDQAQRQALRKEKYTKLLTSSLSRIIFLPKHLPAGNYSLLMQVVVDPKGRILENSLLKSSGNTEADKAMLHCVKVARTVPAPPSGLDNTFQVPLTVSK